MYAFITSAKWAIGETSTEATINMVRTGTKVLTPGVEYFIFRYPEGSTQHGVDPYGVPVWSWPTIEMAEANRMTQGTVEAKGTW